MQKLIEYFIRYPIMGNGILITVVIFGLMALKGTKTTFFPDQPLRDITISATMPGASPREIEEGIVTPLENSVKSVSGIRRYSSTSTENSGTVRIEILRTADIDEVLQNVQSAVNRTALPAEMEPISVYKEEPREPAIDLAVRGDVSLGELKAEARRIEKEFLALPGISKVSVSGFPDEEIEIAVNNEQLHAFNLTINDISSAIRASNVRITGGTIKGSAEQVLIRADAKNYYAADLGNTVVKRSPDGAVVLLNQVAKITDRWEDIASKSFFKGDQSVMIQVSSTRSEDLIGTAKTIRTYAEQYKNSNGISLDILQDRSTTIKERSSILVSNGWQGIVLVILILGVFLHFRLAFWVSLVIPVSLLGMFIISPLYGFTINVMSLMGMILVLGILVDHGIVIAENIYTKFESGMAAIPAAVKGTMEVLPSVIGSVLTTMIIFVAFFFLEGPMGDRSRDIGFVVIATLAISLIEAMFILPAHIAHSKTLHQKPGKEKHTFFAAVERFMEWVEQKLYRKLIRFTTKSVPHALLTVAIPFALLIITMGAVKSGIIKTSYFPEIERRSLNVSLELPAGTVESVTDSLLQVIESKVPALNNQFAKQHGGKEIITAWSRDIRGTNRGSVSLTLIPSDQRKVDAATVANAYRELVGPIVQAERLTFGGGRAFGAAVAIALYGDNLDQLQEAKTWLKTELTAYPFLKDIVDSDSKAAQEVLITLKPIAYSMGLTNQFVMAQVRNSFFGGTVQRLQRGIDEVPVVIRYDEQSRRSVNDLEKLTIRGINGELIPLSEIAEISLRPGVTSIAHQDGEKEIMVSADLGNKAMTPVSANAKISEELIPLLKSRFPGVTVSLRGESEASAETTNSAKVVVPVVLFLMYIVVVYTFRSFSQAAIIFLLIPVSIVGIYWGHFFEGYAVSMLSLFGIIALLGIIVNDSLVLVCTFNQYLKEGFSFSESLRMAGESRLRPVILTSLTTVAGLWPLIKNQSLHAQFLSPMAISVGYGLLYGTLLTLFMLPALLLILNRTKRALLQLWTGKPVDPLDVEPAIREDRESNILATDGLQSGDIA